MSAPAPLPSDWADALHQARADLGCLATRVLYFETIDSTNSLAAAIAADPDVTDAEGTVVIAETQTAGRGRRGRAWFSPPGSGLYVSVLLAPGRASDPARATGLSTLAAGVALADAIRQSTGLLAEIKWPNDLLVGRRKLAGILAEGVRPDASTGADATRVVLGYGINVRPTAFPPELGDRATSIETELGRPVDRAAVWAASLCGLARRYDDLIAGRFDAILDAWRARAPGSRGARVRWQAVDGPRTGVTAGIDDTGALLVRRDGQVERLVAGEVLWD